jgi:hypothetical protein
MNKDSVFKYKGISYDVGTNYVKEGASREIWEIEYVRYDIDVIKNKLNCNSILIYGTDLTRLTECSEIALSQGLLVWVQPRLVDGNKDELITYMEKAAIKFEALREKYSQLILVIGCELSIFANGVYPGKNFMHRTIALSVLWVISPYFNWRLNMLLKRLLLTTKTNFKGEISYGAGDWEAIDWRIFDIIGINHYMDQINRLSYRDKLRNLKKYNKPIVVTEFGCCCFDGAEKKGGGGFQVIDWKKNPPEIKGNHIRNEQVQADYIANLISVFKEEKIAGAFVFTYAEASNMFNKNPKFDLDMASYSLVVTTGEDLEGSPVSGKLIKKMAFDTLAKIYDEMQTKT